MQSYFMSKGLGIAFIEPFFNIFYVIISLELFFKKYNYVVSTK